MNLRICEKIKVLILGLSNIGNKEGSSKLDWEEMVRKEETNQCDVLESEWRKCFTQWMNTENCWEQQLSSKPMLNTTGLIWKVSNDNWISHDGDHDQLYWK